MKTQEKNQNRLSAGAMASRDGLEIGTDATRIEGPRSEAVRCRRDEPTTTVPINVTWTQRYHILTLAKRDRASVLQAIWKLRDAGLDTSAHTAELKELDALIIAIEGPL